MISPAAVILIVFVATVACVFFGGFGLMAWAYSDRVAAEKRLKRMLDGSKGPSRNEILNLLKEKRDGKTDVLFTNAPPFLNLPKLFEQAGIEDDVGSWMLITGLLALFSGGALWFLFQNILYAAIAAAVMILLRYFLILMKRNSRLKKFESLFAQTLEIVGRSLRAGHPFSMGMYMASTEMPDPVGTEFGRVFQETQMGLPLEDSLMRMAQRVPILDVRFFILTVLIHQQTGGDLAEVLDNLSNVIRERFKIHGQVKALTAEGRLSGWVLSALPVFVFFIILVMNREYIMLLLTTELGKKMLYTAIVMQIIGMLLIKKIVNIKV